MNEIFETYVFNVRHGDNILIKFSTGSWGLIDFYYTGNQLEPPSLTYLKSLGNNIKIIIDFVHITHYHQDHTKGVELFFKWLDENQDRVTLKKIWLPGTSPTEKMKQVISELSIEKNILVTALQNETFDELNDFKYHFTLLDNKIDEYLKKEDLTPLICCQTFKVNSEYDALCISPSLAMVETINRDFKDYLLKFIYCIAEKRPYIDENTLSTILVFLRAYEGFKRIKFAFGGDATQHDWHVGLATYEEKKPSLIDDLRTIYSSFIKASHHGSHYSSSVEIWSTLVEPGNKDMVHAFFSSGSMKYPNDETLMHIETVADSHGSTVEKHSTNEKITAVNYDDEFCSVEFKIAEHLQQIAISYGGSRVKLPDSNLVAYKYYYDFNARKAKVTRLIRNESMKSKNEQNYFNAL